MSGVSLYFSIVFVISMFGTSASVAAQAKPIAYVYSGPGSCPQTSLVTGCSEAARAIAVSAGYDVHLIGPNDVSLARSKVPSVWIQPGGEAKVQQRMMAPELQTWIVDFVRTGGGYVGFCAGGFLATERFGWMTEKGPFEAQGLGLLPGRSDYYDSFDNELTDFLHAKIVNIEWRGKPRSVYWELGPYFNAASISNAEVLAYYPLLPGDSEKKAMALQATFGRGRVAITAFHPEAPADWLAYYHLSDPDGPDFSLAVELVQWAGAFSQP